MRSRVEDLGVHGTTNADEPEADHLEHVRRLAVSFGAYAEALFDYHDFGFPKEVIRRHIANVEAGIQELRATDAFDALEGRLRGRRLDARGTEVRDTWNCWKNLRYAAGALMITERFRDELGTEGRTRSLFTKIFYESLLDTLDDIIDTGSYGFADALDLMRHCLAPLTKPAFDIHVFRDELMGRLEPEHRHLSDLLTALADASRRSLQSAPHAAEFTSELERMHERWALGQALTMYQKDPTLDVRAFERGGAQFPAPDSDLSPIERISGSISHTAALTLIDACFMDRRMGRDDLGEHLTAWFYFDAVLSLISNVMDLDQDLEAGIANLFLISCRGSDLSDLRRVRGYRPDLTVKDYEQFLERAGELTRRALLHARRSGADPWQFYPFVTLMFPVVAFTHETGPREDLIHAYLRVLAPVLREAVGRPSLPLPTIPRGTRSGRSRSARIASS